MKEHRYALVRYADDFVVMVDNGKNAHEAYEKAKNFLQENLGLNLHDLVERKKTNIVKPSESPLVFLSVEFDGSSLYPSRDNVRRIKYKFRDICNQNKDKYSVLDLLTKVKNKLDGWVSAFYYTDLKRYEDEIDLYINRQLYLGLSKRDWRFSNKSVGHLPNKHRYGSGGPNCLSSAQRISSGVPLTKDLYNEKQLKAEQIESDDLSGGSLE